MPLTREVLVKFALGDLPLAVEGVDEAQFSAAVLSVDGIFRAAQPRGGLGHEQHGTGTPSVLGHLKRHA
jgi:hypothetical protein